MWFPPFDQAISQHLNRHQNSTGQNPLYRNRLVLPNVLFRAAPLSFSSHKNTTSIDFRVHIITIDCNAIKGKKMANNTITIRTEPEVAEKIGMLAKAMDRSRNWVIEDALKHYIQDQEWQIEGIHQGIQSLDSGQGISHDLIEDRMSKKIAASKTK